MTDRSRSAGGWPTSPRDAAAETPRIRRVAELWCAGVGAGLSLLLLGGFSLVVNHTDAAEFSDSLYHSMVSAGVAGENVDAAYEAARTAGAWYGMTVWVVLALTAVGWLVARGRPERRSTGWWFLAAGLACLVGSQLVLYPVAFLFFVSAGLFALRKPDLGSPE